MAMDGTGMERQVVQVERGLNWRVASPAEVLAASKANLKRYAREGGAQMVNPPATRPEGEG